MKENLGPVICEELCLMTVMIRLYYRKQRDGWEISEERMLKYATLRLERCPFGENKTTCQKCPVHCYQEKYRRQMKQIMRYSGPRMLLHHPVLCIRHAWRGLKRRKMV